MLIVASLLMIIIVAACGGSSDKTSGSVSSTTRLNEYRLRNAPASLRWYPKKIRPSRLQKPSASALVTDPDYAEH